MKRFIDIHVPISNCNLNCRYCYVTQENNKNKGRTIFHYSPEIVKKALSVERLGGICHFNVCGEGETLIPKELIDYIKALLENGHYVMIVTNGTLSNRFDDYFGLPQELKERLGFKFSFHYLQLKERNMLEIFNRNVNKCAENGISYSIEMTPNDEAEPYIDEIKEYCIKNYGALCHLTIPRDMNTDKIKILSKHSVEEFYNIWKTFNSELFDFKYSIWGVKRREYCYAGVWSGLLNLGTGDFSSCYIGKIHNNIFENPDSKIEYIAIGKCCTLPHCYNGHSFLSMGDIPEINTYTYNQLRDRIKKDGSHWLNEKMREFLSTRLEDENEIWTNKEKVKNNERKIKYYTKKCLKKMRKKDEA